MSKTLPKLSWLPDFDGRQRLYQPLNKSRQEIRVAEILEDDDRSAPLRCILRTISLQKERPNHYNALSYYWGSTLDLETVALCGMASAETFYVPITKSLASALRQFRASHQAADGPLVLWTDAICINQLDPDERGQQVAIMRKIYIAATSVWIWLGESDALAEKGLVDTFALAQHHRSAAFSEQNHNMRPDIAFVENAMIGIKDPTQAVELHSLVRSVGALASLPYWYRGWTIQEATASGTVRLQYGLSYCQVASWARLCSSLDNLFYPLIFYLRHEESLKTSLAHLHSWTSTQICYATSEGLKGYTLTDMGLRNHPNAPAQVALSLTILSRTNHWHTSDQRDRLYALTGTMSGFAALDIKPNYRDSVEDLFRRATIELLRVGQSWSHPQFFHPSASPYLPSWVIDFTGCINMENYASVNLSFDHSKRWTAAADSKLRLRQGGLCRPEVLHAAGFLFDEVIAISSYRSPRRPDDVVMQSADTWLELWREHRGYVHDRGKYYNEDVDDVCYRVWCGGMINKDEFDPQHLAAAQDTTHELHTPLWNTINIQYKNRRFAITKGGYMGLVPDSTCVGDRIAVLAGGSMPFVLRKVQTRQVRDDAYILIGGCYIDGIMHGEAVKTAALQAIVRRDFKLAWLAALTCIPLEWLVHCKQILWRKKESDEELAFNGTICLV